jgi:transposase
LPAGVIEGAKYEASVFAYVATAKYCDHLPLNRLEGILKRQGLHLPKQTMWDMLVRVDELVAQPVLAQMRRELLEEEVLLADETPVTMRVEDGQGSRTSYAWCWRNAEQGGGAKVLLEFRESRGRDGPRGFLGAWKGTLLTDGYSGYDEVVARNGIVRAGCWAHARRKLKEALDAGTREAALVLVHVQRLFRIERALKWRAERDGLAGDKLRSLRARVREARSRRVVSRIHEVAADLAGRGATLPKSQLGKALTYLDHQRDELAVFLDDPRIPIHNNATERDVRHLAVGRKNWMIFASKRGGEVACRLYSLVLSCRQAGADPQAYLEDVLHRVSTTPAREIASLTPWAWAKTRAESLSA